MVKLMHAATLVMGASLLAAMGGFGGMAWFLLVAGGVMLGIGLART